MQEKIDKLISFKISAKKRSKRFFATFFNLYLNVKYTKITSLYMYRFNQNKPSGAYITYACTERIFDSRLLMYNKIFLESSYRSL